MVYRFCSLWSVVHRTPRTGFIWRNNCNNFLYTMASLGTGWSLVSSLVCKSQVSIIGMRAVSTDILPIVHTHLCHLIAYMTTHLQPPMIYRIHKHTCDLNTSCADIWLAPPQGIWCWTKNRWVYDLQYEGLQANQIPEEMSTCPHSFSMSFMFQKLFVKRKRLVPNNPVLAISSHMHLCI